MRVRVKVWARVKVWVRVKCHPDANHTNTLFPCQALQQGGIGELRGRVGSSVACRKPNLTEPFICHSLNKINF